MNKLIVICLLGVTLCMSLLVKDIVNYIKAKKMITKTINNCFKAVEEKDVK